MLVAQWLVILAFSLVVLPGNAFASSPVTSTEVCNASCAARCPCCVSKAPASSPSAPLAPTPQSRVSVEKNFQVLPVPAVLLTPVREVTSLALPGVLSLSFGPEAPLHQRHCVYLI